MKSLITGNITLESLAASASSGEIDTVITAFVDMYGRLMGKRHTARYFLEHVAHGGMHVCDYLLACDIEMDPVPGYGFTNWERGYGDMMALPDLVTLRKASWLPKTALVLCDLLSEDGTAPISVSPRQILRKQIERAAEMGYVVRIGAEIETYLFDETYESARTSNYARLKPAASYIEDYHLLQGTKEEGVIGEIRRHLESSGVPVESSKGEWGPGQQEVNLDYCEAIEHADRCVIYKHAAKEIAMAAGKAVTFMAKWDEHQAGSSMHIHVSLWKDGGRTPVFVGNEHLGPVTCAPEFAWFLGGWMSRAKELSAFYAPNVSSYKRYQAGSFAPTSIAWSHDNRTAGFRVVGHGKALRVECRIPGADANPFLVAAVSIAAGLDGIRSKTAPPPIFEGDVYQAADLPRVPNSLHEAIDALNGSTFARAALSDFVVEHYLHFFRTEQRKFDAVVTDWERARFFERI